MPRYEFVEGSSKKFWEIALEGSSFTTTYGRIGTDGQMSMKEFDSEAKAQKEHDKLIAEKTAKGYVLVDGASAAAAAAAPPAKAPPPVAAKAAAPSAAATKKASAVFEDEGDDEEPAPKKKAAAAAPKAEKPAPAAAATAGTSKSSDDAARYFEFVDGSSSKFWEIKLEGSSFTTRYGKIGTDGQMSMKEYDSDDKAQKEHDKLVTEKTKKGYVEK